MKHIFISVFLLYALAFRAFGQEKLKDNQKYITKQVTVKGLVEKPLVLTVDDLKQMNVEEINNYKVTNHEGIVKKEITSFKGVALREVLEAAKVTMKNPKDRGKYFVIVSAGDGYTVIFAYNELMFGNTQAYLAFEADGKPLTEDGLIALFTSSDKVTGPRHLKWLQSVEIKKL